MFLSQLKDHVQQAAQLDPHDLDFLISSGFVLRATKEDYEKGVNEVGRLSQIMSQVNAEKADEQQSASVLQGDEAKEHSFLFHFKGKDEKDALLHRIQDESAAVSQEESQLAVLEKQLNELIQEKSLIDRMMPYDSAYLAITDLGTLTLNDLNIRNYRIADEDFSTFLVEMKNTFSELRLIAQRSSAYVSNLKPVVPVPQNDLLTRMFDSELWGAAVGLAKLQGDTAQISQRYINAFSSLNTDFTVDDRLMAAEIMTAMSSFEISDLQASLGQLESFVRDHGVPKEQAAGVAATILAGRRFDGTYPADRFTRFMQSTSSYRAAAILSVMNLPDADILSKFDGFRSMFKSWGYMTSEDTEISSAFLSIGELGPNDVEDKLKYVIEQLKNYLEYPLVPGAILASIPVFESHEVLDLMEKAVTLLSAFAAGLERSELVTLAVRMIHGVRNELIKELDPTATLSETPIQFSYGTRPFFFIWYYPLISAHSYHTSNFGGMGGFHPAHSHGVGGFAG